MEALKISGYPDTSGPGKVCLVPGILGTYSPSSCAPQGGQQIGQRVALLCFC